MGNIVTRKFGINTMNFGFEIHSVTRT